MPRKKQTISPVSQKPPLPPGNPSGTKPQAKLSGTLSESANKLDQVAAKIDKEKALKAAEQKVNDQKKEKLINSQALPLPEGQQSSGFVPDPMVVTIASGFTFWAMKQITHIFKKDLYPLKEEQQKRLETFLDKMARKHIPADWTKYQENGEVFFVLGGIVVENLTDLKNPEKPALSGPAKDEQKPPTIPAVPEAKVTVVTAEAPPVPEGVK